MIIRLPVDRLPQRGDDRHVKLREYFCDKDAIANFNDGAWDLTLTWPDGVERHIDPRLDEGLAWWGDDVVRSTMALASRRTGRVLRALYDSWTLFSWCQQVARWQGLPERLTILHVDDHFDLSPPRMLLDPGGFRDAITGMAVDLARPDSVREAILSGAIGMGSFLTPFLHFVPTAEVRHLRQPPKTRATFDHRIILETSPDTLLHPGAPRPAIRLDAVPGAVGPGFYRITSDMCDWLDGVGDGPVLLHLDLDYLNNRYDGDSDWLLRSDPLDPSQQAILEKVDEMATALLQAGLVERLNDVAVAYSPGFFPAEFWHVVDERLRDRLGL